jgi:autotransporter-associated beta strand protein
MKKIVGLLGIIALMAGVAQATTYTWDGVGDTGTSSANTRLSTGSNWVGDATPANANDTDWVMTYNAAAPGTAPGSTYNNFTVRSITFDDSIDAAYGIGINRSTAFIRSITMSSDSGPASINVASGATGNISITGTLYSDGTQNALILASDLNVIHNGTGSLNLSARITGANDITKTGTGTLQLSSAQNDFTGDMVINEGRMTLLNGGQLFYAIGATGVNNSLSGTGEAVLNGNFRFDLTGASTTVGDSWTIVDVATLDESFTADQFGALSTVGSFTEVNDVWTIAENGVSYEFSEVTGVLTVIPEPATIGMLGLGALITLLIRRYTGR